MEVEVRARANIKKSPPSWERAGGVARANWYAPSSLPPLFSHPCISLDLTSSSRCLRGVLSGPWISQNSPWSGSGGMQKDQWLRERGARSVSEQPGDPQVNLPNVGNAEEVREGRERGERGEREGRERGEREERGEKVSGEESRRNWYYAQSRWNDIATHVRHMNVNKLLPVRLRNDEI